MEVMGGPRVSAGGDRSREAATGGFAAALRKANYSTPCYSARNATTPFKGFWPARIPMANESLMWA
jgi:hypothetical protein